MMRSSVVVKALNPAKIMYLSLILVISSASGNSDKYLVTMP